MPARQPQKYAPLYSAQVRPLSSADLVFFQFLFVSCHYILFNFFGIFLFDTLIYYIELGFISAMMFVILGVIGVACTFFAWKDEQK